MSLAALLSTGDRSWYTNPRFQKWALGILATLAVLEGFWTVFFRDNDFLWHRHHAEYFLEGRPHGDHYLPARGFMDIPLAVAPYRLTRAVAYIVAVLMLLGCYRLWNDMAARTAPTSVPVVRSAGMLTIFLLLPYVMRDLDECGLQIVLMFFITVAGWALSRGKSLQVGFWLGTAACYKATPLLFLPFLLWKRQWRAAAWMGVFSLLWCAAPSLYSGWEENLQSHKNWLAGMRKSQPTQQAYPSLPDGGDMKLNNMSLLAGIARYLETYPKDHPLFVNDKCLENPLFFQFGNLPPDSARYTMYGILASLGSWFAWKTRRLWGVNYAQPQAIHGAFVGEWAAVCALCALLSPLCWKQHMILILPCMFLAIRSKLNAKGPFGGRMSPIWACSALMCLFPGPDIFGGSFSAVLHSYKLHTLGATILMVRALFLPWGGAGAAIRAVTVGSRGLLPRAA